MANANSNTSSNNGDFDKFEQLSDQVAQHLREVEAISGLVRGFDKNIPREIAENVGESIYTRAKAASSFLDELWRAYSDASEKLTIARQIAAMAHKEGVDHG